MKAVTSRASLLAALQPVARVVPKKTSIPILGNVRVCAEGDTLILTGTDLERKLTNSVAAEVEQAGMTTVPAHFLLQIVKASSPGSEIRLETKRDGPLNVQLGSSKVRLATLPEADFPDFAETPFSHAFELPGRVFRRLFERTAFAISTDEVRYNLSGVLIHRAVSRGENVLRGVATDGHRLAIADIPAPDESDGVPEIIVPRRTVGELLKMTDTNDSVWIEVSETKIRVTVGAMVMSSRLIDGIFPDYRRVVPTGNDKTFVVAPRPLSAAVERVMSIVAAKSDRVRLDLRHDAVTLCAGSAAVGYAFDEVSAEFSSHLPLEIGFNGRYLRDLTSRMLGDSLTMKLGGLGAPAVVMDDGDEASLYLLMPMPT